MEWRSERDPTRSLFDEALRFVDESKSGSVRDAELIEWATRSPEHVSAFLEAWELWREVSLVTPARRARIDKLAADLAEAHPHVVWLDDAPVSTQHPVTARSLPQIIAFCVVGVAVAGLAFTALRFFFRVSPTVYETGNWHQSFVMNDGSHLHLNSDSRVQTRLRDGFRDVELLRGEALFDVDRDPRRPFRAASGEFIAESQDARFDMHVQSGTVSLLVIQGRLAVTNRGKATNVIPLQKGQLAVFNRARPLTSLVPRTLDAVEINRELGWTDRLKLDGVRLSDAIEQFNLNNRTKIQFDDPGPAGLRIGGTFNLIDPDGFVLALRPFGIESMRRDSRSGTTYRLCAAPCGAAAISDAQVEELPPKMF